MKFTFTCPNQNKVFESSDFEILENKGVIADPDGNKILDAQVALSKPCPFCGKTHVYRAADLVTYPSGYEGFGNAFVEAIYFKKPIVVNRYSIYVENIEPCGFQVISFESFVTKEIAGRIKQFIKPENLQASVDKNYELGKKYFSYEVLEALLIPIIESF